MQTEQMGEVTFESRSNSLLAAIGLFAVAGVGFFFVAISIVLMFISTNASSTMPGVIGGMTVVPVALAYLGYNKLRMLRKVTLNDQQILLDGPLTNRTIRWTDVHSVVSDKRSQIWGSSFDVIRLRNARGKSVAEIPNSFGDDFPDLRREIDIRVAAIAGEQAVDPSLGTNLQAARGRKMRKLMLVLLTFLLLVFVSDFIVSLNEYLHERRFATEGLTVDATIDRTWIHVVTPQIEYTFQDREGKSHSRHTQMFEPPWRALEGRKTVPVIYLSSDPEWSHLANGEDTERASSGLIWLSAGGALFLGLMLVGVVLGYDFESVGGQHLLKRHGKVIRTWGARPPSSPGEGE